VIRVRARRLVPSPRPMPTGRQSETVSDMEALKTLIQLKAPEEKVIALDAELDVFKNARGMIHGAPKIPLVQLVYKDDDAEGTIRATLAGFKDE
jgi:hypothetical protein